MATPLVRRLTRPAAAVVAVAAVGGLILLFKVNVVAGIVTPVVVAFLTGWVVHRFPQLRRPVAVTAKLTDVDYVVGDSRVPASGHTVRITVEATGPLTVVLDRLRPVHHFQKVVPKIIAEQLEDRAQRVILWWP